MRISKKLVYIGFIIASSTILLYLLVPNFTENIHTNNEAEPDIIAGEKIFLNDCEPCHHKNSQFSNKLVSKLMKQMDVSYFQAYITNQDSLILAKHKRVMNIMKEFGTTKSNHNFKYTKRNLQNLIAFLNKL